MFLILSGALGATGAASGFGGTGPWGPLGPLPSTCRLCRVLLSHCCRICHEKERPPQSVSAHALAAKVESGTESHESLIQTSTSDNAQNSPQQASKLPPKWDIDRFFADGIGAMQ